MRKILSFLVLLLFAVTMSAETWVLGERADITQLKAGDVIALKSITTVKADENPSNVWFGAYHTLKSNAFPSGIANFGFGLFPQIKDRSAFELVAGPGHGTAASFYLKEMTSGQYIALTRESKGSINLVADATDATDFVLEQNPQKADADLLVHYEGDTGWRFTPFHSYGFMYYGNATDMQGWNFYYVTASTSSFLQSDQVDCSELADGMELLLQNASNRTDSYGRPASVGEQYLDNYAIADDARAHVYQAGAAGSLAFSSGYSESNVWVLEATGTPAADADHSAAFYIKNKQNNEYLTVLSSNAVATTANLSDAFVCVFGPASESTTAKNWSNAKTVSLKANGKLLGSAHCYGYSTYDWGDAGILNLYKIAPVTDDSKKQEAYNRLQELITTDEATYTGDIPTDRLPGYDAASVVTYQTTLAAAKAITMSNTIEEINNAYLALDSSLPTELEIEDGAYYYIVSALNTRTDKPSVCINKDISTTDLRWGLLDEDNGEYIFQFTKNPDKNGYWYIQCLGNDLWIDNSTGSYGTYAVVAESKGKSHFFKSLSAAGGYNAYFWYTDPYSYTSWRPNSATTLTNTSGQVYNWGASGDANTNNYNRWYLYKVSEESLGTVIEAKKAAAFQTLTEQIAAYEAEGLRGGIDPGACTEASMQTFETALATAKAVTSTDTYEVQRTAYENLIAAHAALETNPITEGYYFIVSAGNGTGYPANSGNWYNYEDKNAMYNDGEIVKWKAYDRTDVSQVFYLTQKEGISWYVQNVKEGTYIDNGGTGNSGTVYTSADKVNGQEFNLMTAGTGKYAIKSPSYCYGLAQNHNGTSNASGNLCIWGTVNDCRNLGVNVWYLHKLTDEEVENFFEDAFTELEAAVEAIKTPLNAENYKTNLQGTERGGVTSETEKAKLQAVVAAAKEVINSDTATEDEKAAAYNNAKAAFDTCPTDNPIVDGHYYIYAVFDGLLLSYRTVDGADYAYKANWSDPATSLDMASVFEVKKTGENAYTVQNVKTGKYLGAYNTDHNPSDKGSFVLQSDPHTTYIVPWRASHNYLEANKSYGEVTDAIDFCLFSESTFEHEYSGRWIGSGWNIHSDLGDYVAHAWRLLPVDEAYDAYMAEKDFNDLIAAADEALAVPTPANHHDNDPARNRSFLLGNEKLSVDGLATSKEAKDALQAARDAVYEGYKTDGKSLADMAEEVAALNSAIEAVNAKSNPLVDGYYHLVAEFDGGTDGIPGGFVIEADGDGIKKIAYNANEPKQMFKVEYDAANGKVYLQNVANGKYLGVVDGSAWKFSDERIALNVMTGNKHYWAKAADVTVAARSCSFILYDAAGKGIGSDNCGVKNDVTNTGTYAWLESWAFRPADEYYADYIANGPLKTAIENLADAYANLEYGTNPGEYAQAGVEAFQNLYASDVTAYNGGNNTLTIAEQQTMADALSAAYQTAINTRIPLTDGYYVIKSAASAFGANEYAMYIDNNGKVAWKAYDAAAPGEFIFQLTDQNATVTPDGITYEVFSYYNVAQKKYIGQCSSQMASEDASTSDEVWGACAQVLTPAGQFAIQPMWNPTTVSFCLTVDNTSNTSGIIRTSGWYGGYSGGNNNGSWKFEKVDLEAVTIGATGYSTYVSDKALIVPEGVTANGVTGLDGSDVELTQLSGNVLAADEPVILQGEAGKKFYFIATNEIGNTIAGNLLEGTGTEGKSIGANEAYVLYNNSGTAVFRIAGAMTLPAHKAYLPAGVVNGAGAKEFGLGGLTGINNAQTSNLESQTYFDLQGRKVAAPQKGQLYIVNGKKVLY